MLVPPVIILFVASSVICFVTNKYKVNKYNINTLLLPVLIYLFYVVGVLFSEDTKSAGFDLEVKLSLILLPLCFLIIPQPDFKLGFQLFKKFILGCFAGMCLCIISAIINYYIRFDFESFFYTSLSHYHHPSYFAMYLVFSVTLILIYIIHNYYKLSKAVLFTNISLILLLSVFVIMLASKAGVLSLGAVIFSFCIYFIVKYKKYVAGISAILILGAISFFVVSRSQTLKNRITESLSALSENKQVDENLQTTSLRKVIWKSSFELIRDNLWGYGTGDVKSVLMERYKIDGNTQAGHKHLNAHNQFLQTTLAIGIIGLIVLLLIVFYPMVYLQGIQKIVFIFFSLSFIIFCLTESMLETQSGVIFFAFFYSLINSISSRESQAATV